MSAETEITENPGSGLQKTVPSIGFTGRDWDAEELTKYSTFEPCGLIC